MSTPLIMIHSNKALVEFPAMIFKPKIPFITVALGI